MRVNVACPLCKEQVTLTVMAEPTLTHGSNGPKGFISVALGASGIEHTCQGEGWRRVDDDPVDTTLERELETVLTRYGVPMMGLPMRVYEPRDGGPVVAMPVGRDDRGDMASDLAAVARHLLVELRDGAVIE